MYIKSNLSIANPEGYFQTSYAEDAIQQSLAQLYQYWQECLYERAWVQGQLIDIAP